MTEGADIERLMEHAEDCEYARGAYIESCVRAVRSGEILTASKAEASTLKAKRAALREALVALLDQVQSAKELGEADYQRIVSLRVRAEKAEQDRDEARGRAEMERDARWPGFTAGQHVSPTAALESLASFRERHAMPWEASLSVPGGGPKS